MKKELFTKYAIAAMMVVVFSINALRADIVICTIKKASCNAPDGSITLKVTSGAKPYAFVLIGPVNMSGSVAEETITINNLSKGDYVLMITDSHGCGGSKEFSIEETDMRVDISVNGSPYTCGEEYANEMLLIATANGGVPPYIYSWPNGKYFTFLPGYYACTATDVNGCTKTGSVNFIIFPSLGGSGDPNFIKGPGGFGKSRYVSINDKLQYLVHFENDPKIATQPAQRVIITMNVDKHLDLYSFSLGNFGFGKCNFAAPENRLFYQTRLDLADSLGYWVDISTGIDVSKNQAYWIFETIDPKTGSKNTLDLTKGFLPVNDTVTHAGEGFISFTMKPKNNCQTADSVRISADIIFDKNDAMNTGVAWNLIDAKPPASAIDTIYFDPFTSRYMLSFVGKDDTLGCGLKDYSLYLSENGAPYHLYQANIPNNTFPFLGKNGTKYSFFAGARDNVNNSGVLTYTPNKSILCTNEPFLISPTKSTDICSGMELPVTWKPAKGAYIDLEFSKDNGKSFSLIASELDAFTGRYSWKIPHMINGVQKGLIRAVNTNSRVTLDTSEVFTVREGIVVDAGTNQSICSGTEFQLGGNPTATKGVKPYSYAWSSAGQLDLSQISNPTTTPSASSTYTVIVSDAGGCIGKSSVNISVDTLPAVSIIGLQDSYCSKAVPVILSAIPDNGNFSGDGILNNTFYPSQTSIGIHHIVYNFQDNNSCEFSITKEVNVDLTPDVDFTGFLDHYNVNNSPVMITGTPEGGTFSGNGITGNTFDPAKAQLGLNSISYSYTASSGCSGTVTKQIVVDNFSDIQKINDVLCIDEFKVFPNNPIENLTIYFTPCRGIDGIMKLFDVNGKCLSIIKSGHFSNEIITYNVSNLTPGVYFIVVYAGQKLSYQKFMKGSHK